MTELFSQRFGHAEPDAEITTRNGEPGDLRGVLVDIAYESGISPKGMRQIVGKVLRVPPDRGNWSNFPNVDDEVRGHLESCYWSYVYDVLQEVYEYLASKYLNGDISDAEAFAGKVNDYFRRRGYGWQILNGAIEVRGPEIFEAPVRTALRDLGASDRQTTRDELQEAIHDISRRPEPDVTGAIQHGMAALECLARDITGDTSSTLGKLINDHPELFPKPVGDAVSKLWGYTSNEGRHLMEGASVDFEDAELVVHLASALSLYLMHKFDDGARNYPAGDLDDLPFN